ncbi:MAG: beta-Ala-His dipeptidase [Lentisphaeria bacterium]|nr:beta-Ala-His dipeptidase [Lentisphaeria bacterium]
MSEISSLAPQAVWQIFDMICSVPHISKHEAALSAKLAALAREAGLTVITDEYHNLVIRRAAAAGWKNAPGIILQAHMDMVPASEGEFDFINTPITPYIADGFVRARGTTLGADDGIGAAHALAVILDKDFRCGELTVILTTDEEAGMSGARNLAPEHLQKKYMINLDTGGKGFCIGCAGGARQKFIFKSVFSPAVSGNPVKITVSGLPGGHSGCCIHENRGNALKFIAEFAGQQPDLYLSAIDGGTADNAIPDSVQATGIFAGPIDKLQKSADAFALLLKKELPAAAGLSIAVVPAEMPQMVWEKMFQQELLNAMMLVPDGPLGFDEELQIVKTSSNLATIRTTAQEVIIKTSQRSLDDGCRDDICAAIRTHFELFNACCEIGDIYPATPPKKDSELLKIAMKCAEKSGRGGEAYAIHAGLESGWFSVKNPELEIISCGPDHTDYHTPYEKLEIASVKVFDGFLRELIRELGK